MIIGILCFGKSVFLGVKWSVSVVRGAFEFCYYTDDNVRVYRMKQFNVSVQLRH